MTEVVLVGLRNGDQFGAASHPGRPYAEDKTGSMKHSMRSKSQILIKSA